MIGEGGMGRVFKAVHRRMGRVVALKVIRKDRLSQSPEAVRRFGREARAAAQLSHPHVVMIFDADEIDQRHFIAMEYVEGIDLAHLVEEKGPLAIRLACDYIRQAALGLQHAYEQGMVHRDIKPSNLLVSKPTNRSGILGRKHSDAASAGVSSSAAVIKILDMGLARIMDATEGGLAASSLTQEGSVVGTPDYIAPEQARNSSKVDIRADLYSLGCTFYFLLTGHPPFPEGTTVEKLLMHQMDEPQPLDELRREVPTAVHLIVTQANGQAP